MRTLPYYIYLAGPMSGITYPQGFKWRCRARDFLMALGIQVLSPMRELQLEFGQNVMGQTNDACPLTTAKGIRARDRLDVSTCDLVLMNLVGAKSVTIGTMIESGWADAFQVPVVLAMEPGNLHEHPMLTENASWRTHTLDEALRLIPKILLP